MPRTRLSSAHTLLLFLLGACCLAGSARAESSARTADATAPDVLFYDRLHQTFLLLNQVAIPAYVEHFQGEPEQLAVVQYYVERLAAAQQRDRPGTASAVEPGDLVGGATRDAWMRAALVEASRGNVDALEHYLTRLGAAPHAIVQRSEAATGLGLKARCSLFDPELLWAHRRLWELRSRTSVPAAPSHLPNSLADRQAAVRALRAQTENSELSLRKFLDKHRQIVWEIGWLCRCLGVAQERAGDATQARDSYLRAAAIGDALFPASDRGRLHRFDRVFLAELGDVYARLGRYDLMLRYIYSEEGLPARYEMAKPIAELARVAESVRLARHDEAAMEQTDELLPETVSGILFEQPVLPSAGRQAQAVVATRSVSKRAGYALIGCGAVVLIGAVVWRLALSNGRSPGNGSSRSSRRD